MSRKCKEVRVYGLYQLDNGAVPREVVVLQDLASPASQMVSTSVESNPAALYVAGELEEDWTILADSQAIGAVMACKARYPRVTGHYPQIDQDALLCLASREGKMKLSNPNGAALIEGLQMVPAYFEDKAASEAGKAELYKAYILGAGANIISGKTYITKVRGEYKKIMEDRVLIAQELAKQAKEIVPGVWSVDITRSDRFDLNHLKNMLHNKPGCIMTVLRLTYGAIARHFDTSQYSVSIRDCFKNTFNVRSLVDEETEFSVENGVLSPSTTQLEVSEECWNASTMWRLKMLFTPTIQLTQLPT